MSAIQELIEAYRTSEDAWAYKGAEADVAAAAAELKELEGRLETKALKIKLQREALGHLRKQLAARDRRDAELREVISRYECDPDEWEGEHTTEDCLTCIAKRWAKGGGQ